MKKDTRPHLALPEVVGWETTLRCNMRCLHCGSTAGDARGEELSEREALALCRQIADWGVGRVVLTGGETLLRRDWRAIVEELLGAGVEVGLLTNGWTLTPRVLKQLSAYSALPFHLSVSLDGTPEVHDHIRGLAGSFERAFRGAQELKAAGVPVAVITTVNHANIPGLPELGERILGELAPYCWQIQVTTPFGRAREYAETAVSPVEYAQAAVYVCRARREAGSGTRVYAGDCIGYLSSIEPGLREVPWDGCQAGLRLLGIQSNGNVKGCLSIVDDAYVEGNALGEGLRTLWERPGSFAFTRQFRKSDLAGDCRRCAVGAQCRGGCSANSISWTGKAGRAPYCLRAVEDAAGRRATPRRASKKM